MRLLKLELTVKSKKWNPSCKLNWQAFAKLFFERFKFQDHIKEKLTLSISKR